MNLHEEIRTAFDRVKYPGDERLLSSPNDESRQFIRKLRGKNWHVITLDDVAGSETIYDTLSALNPHAFHFYLPGFLLLALDDSGEGCPFGHAITGQFTANDLERSEGFADRQKAIQLLTTPQRMAVRHFFEWLRQFNTHCPVLIDSAIDNLAHDRIRPYSTSAVTAWSRLFKE